MSSGIQLDFPRVGANARWMRKKGDILVEITDIDWKRRECTVVAALMRLRDRLPGKAVAPVSQLVPLSHTEQMSLFISYCKEEQED